MEVEQITKQGILAKIEEENPTPVPTKPQNFNQFTYTDDSGVEKVNIDAVAEFIKDKFDIKTVYGLRDELIYVYEDGIWKTTGKGLIKAECEKLLGSFAKNNTVSEILEKIKRMTETPVADFEKVPAYKVCLKNGVLDIENIADIKLLPHAKEYNFKAKMPLIYDPLAKCPIADKFIADSFYPTDILQVQEWLGHHLPKRYLFKKAVILHGPQDAGKSVFVNMLSFFVGYENVTGLSLQKISFGKGFDLFALKDKLANIHDDLSSKDLQDGGGFKMAVGDGIISGEEKFGDQIRFRNSAKMTFACNQIPPVKDIDDQAYYGRWLTWALDNVVSKEEKNPKLIEQLTTESELSGLLNWAIEGYKRLMTQNGFSNEKTPDEIKALMIQNGNPLAQFASDCLEQKNGEGISKELMYQTYCEYCNKNNFSPCSKEQLGRQLNRFASYLLPGKSGSERYWLNAILKDNIGTLGTHSENNDIQAEVIKVGSKYKDIIISEVSQPPQKTPILDKMNKNLDTWDTIEEKDEDPDFEDIDASEVD